MWDGKRGDLQPGRSRTSSTLELKLQGERQRALQQRSPHQMRRPIPSLPGNRYFLNYIFDVVKDIFAGAFAVDTLRLFI